MIVSSIGLLAAVALQITRFGPYQNIVVEQQGGEAHISAYGDAHVVRLHGAPQQLSGCVTAIKTGKAMRCPFSRSGALTFRPITEDSYQFTFTDALNVNIVDFTVDDAGLERALAAMSAAK